MVGYPGVTLAPAQRMQRQMRYPQFPFYVRSAPFVIQPFLYHPVLPGETMKNLLMQARVVTDPINNPLIGWWTEFMFFYVKLSDLYEREDAREMLLNTGFDLSTFTGTTVGTTASLFRFFAGGTNQVDWQKLCNRVIIDHYFRDEDETYATTEGLYDDTGEASPVVNLGGGGAAMAKIVGKSFLDSAELSDTQESSTNDPVLATIDEAGAATHVITAKELRDVQVQYEMAKLYNLTEMSFDDYLAAQGINVPGVVVHRPELIRHIREWSYPTNTIDPTNGTPRSAVSWSIRERADKHRAFSEPGFLVGIQVTRPKVYAKASTMAGSLVSSFNDYKAWMPSFLHQVDPTVTLKELAHDAGPLAPAVTDTDGYWIDLKDLLLYGEQFYWPGATAAKGFTVNEVSIPGASLQNKTYATHADVEAMFVNGSTGSYGVNTDGVVNLAIASSPMNPIRDTTPRGGRNMGETSGGF